MYKIMNQRVKPFAKWERVQHFNPSGYIRKGTLQVFHKIKRQYPNDYIVCIGYDRGDTQFVLTETFKTFEKNVEDVIDRCLKEECCIERVEKKKPDVYTFYEKFATIYCVPLRIPSMSQQFKPCSNTMCEEDPYLNQNDDKTRKLVLLLHGDLTSIQNVFQHFYSSEKEIDHLLVLPCQDIQKAFPKFFPQSFYSISSTYSNNNSSYFRLNYTPVY